MELKAESATMNPEIVIRDETPDDVRAITAVTIAAFKTVEISNHAEQFIIEALRRAGALTLSLVAEMDGPEADGHEMDGRAMGGRVMGGRGVGHIAFSPVTVSDGTPNWYGLGPVSVLPRHQRKGIGKALIREGLSRLKGMGARGCCLVGHPGYYSKLGFKNVPGLAHDGVPPEVFFVMSFDGRTPQGTVAFHEGFKGQGEQG